MKTQSKEYRSSVAVKIGVSRQVVIPKRIHDQLGLEPGDYLEVELEGDRVIMTPKALIEKRLAEGLNDIRKGRVRGPFRSVRALVRSLRKATKTRIVQNATFLHRAFSARLRARSPLKSKDNVISSSHS